MRTRRRHSPSTSKPPCASHHNTHRIVAISGAHTPTDAVPGHSILTTKPRGQSQLFFIYNYKQSYQGTLQGNVSSTRSLQKSPLYHECWSDFRGHKYLKIPITH